MRMLKSCFVRLAGSDYLAYKKALLFRAVSEANGERALEREIGAVRALLAARKEELARKPSLFS